MSFIKLPVLSVQIIVPLLFFFFFFFLLCSFFGRGGIALMLVVLALVDFCSWYSASFFFRHIPTNYVPPPKKKKGGFRFFVCPAAPSMPPVIEKEGERGWNRKRRKEGTRKMGNGRLLTEKAALVLSPSTIAECKRRNSRRRHLCRNPFGPYELQYRAESSWLRRVLYFPKSKLDLFSRCFERRLCNNWSPKRKRVGYNMGGDIFTSQLFQIPDGNIYMTSSRLPTIPGFTWAGRRSYSATFSAQSRCQVLYCNRGVFRPPRNQAILH